MTLTSQLRDSSSPLATLFAATLPDVDAVLESFRDKVSPAPLPVRPRAPAGATVPWATVGTAVDLRLRWALTGAPSEDRAVEHGLARAVDVLEWDPPAECDVPAGELFAAAGREVLRRVEDLFERVSPWDRTRPVRLSAPEEDLLDRAAFVLAEFAELYRARRVGLLLGGVYEGRGAVTADGLLAAVPAYVAADLAAMAGRADVGLAALRSGTTPAEVTAGPQFAGSDAAGNADGDWVAGGLLVDVKATLHPERLGAVEVYQLAGYALLDWGDRYRLDSVGWYLARQGVLPAWGLTEFLQLLGWGRTLGELRGLTARALGRQSPGAVTPVPPDGAVPGWVVRTAAEIAAVRAAAYRRYAAEPRAAWHGGVVKAIDWVLGTGPGPLTGRRGPVTRWTEDAEVDAARAVIEGTTVAEAWRRSAGAADPPVELLPSLVIDHEWARGVVNACGWLHGGVPVLPGLTDP